MYPEFVKHQTISLRSHPYFSELWVQDIIAKDPSILGLGKLELKDRERRQPRAGRLDLLLQDPDSKRRYEVEIQLGTCDESHIIRTIEYWDIERKRYPQHDHCAVIVAEDITSRFLNVVSLFNGTIPLIAIQMKAIQIDQLMTLVFTTVLDEMTLGLVDDDEDTESVPTDRAYWEQKATPATVRIADELLELAKSIDDSLTMKYNKHYIGLARNNSPMNFVTFRPKKDNVLVEFKIPKSTETDELIESAELDLLDYNSRWRCYRIRIEEQNVVANKEVLEKLVKAAYERRTSD